MKTEIPQGRGSRVVVCARAFGRRKMGKEHKTGDAMGRPRWGWSFLGDPGAKFFCAKRATATSQEAMGQKRVLRRNRKARHHFDGFGSSVKLDNSQSPSLWECGNPRSVRVSKAPT